jgi:hypothetical protein
MKQFIFLVLALTLFVISNPAQTKITPKTKPTPVKPQTQKAKEITTQKAVTSDGKK